MRSLLHATRIITPDEEYSPGWVLVRDGVIEGVGAGLPPDATVPALDLGEHTLVPGFVDIHVHGGGGFSLMTADVEEVRSHARWVVSHGVTSLVATIVGADTSQGLEFVGVAASATGAVEGGATVLGVYLEGPFVSERYRGALPKTWLKSVEPDLVDVFADTAVGHLRLMTLAPELDNDKLIRRAVARGVRVAVGHSGADSDTTTLAFNAGASHVTHLFNAMRPFHHRDPGILGAAFDNPEVTVEIIADNVHLDPTTVDMAIRLFGPGRIALVSDASLPAGVGQGVFKLGDDEAHLVGDRMVLADGTIAGGIETMDRLVRNVVQWKCATLPEAVRMASAVPASVAGASHKGRIAPGYDADLVALTPELAVAATWVRGVSVHSSIGSDPAH